MNIKEFEHSISQIENRMFLENLTPVKQEAERWQREKMEAERKLKRKMDR